ncbi:hypothetical protein [Novacetimonas pomaceti]|uniref:hypothetical protein n=1 Tax=Novacetimonas pomaceti TaxID=2021998 RepID=UPI001057C180|nr:hypothetical protein [Novacetimonas pomaceti]
MKIDTRIIFDLTDGFQSYVEMSQVHSGISVKESRTLIWGPYIKVPAGSWTVIFNGEFEGKEAQSFCDVCAEGGLTVMGICNLRSGKGKIAEISFTNIIANTNVEFRVTPAAGSHIRIDNIILQQHSDNCATIPDVGRNFAIYERSGLNLLLDAESTVDHDAEISQKGCTSG